jgi:hypothetical protein
MSEILVDNLTGKTSAGSITVTSEGGAATQSLQQGLAKAWFKFDQTVPSNYSSFNVSSVSDDAIGVYTQNWANSFSDAHYPMGMVGDSYPNHSHPACYIFYNDSTAQTTSSCKYDSRGGTNGTAYDQTNLCNVHGDLS